MSKTVFHSGPIIAKRERAAFRRNRQPTDMGAITMPIHDLLSRLGPFNGLSDNQLNDIAQASAEIKARRGEWVFRRGDLCNGFYIVVCGQIKLALVSSQGAEKVMRILGPGESFGEEFMFMDKPHILSAQALTDAGLVNVPMMAVLAQLIPDHRFARKMLGRLSQRLRELVSDIEAYSLKSGSQRVIDYLLECDQCVNTSSCHFKSSKALIASRLNLTPEHFSRILHGLSMNHLIRVKGRAITIVDIEKLRNYQGRILP